MAVKEGLPATDFSKMNREYIRNVAEGETVKDGLPATDFSRMNREYIKAVVEEYGGGGGGGGGDSDFSTAEVTINTESYFNFDVFINVTESTMEPGIYIDEDTKTVTAVLYKGHSTLYSSFIEEGRSGYTIVCSDTITELADGVFDVTGDGSITITEA